MPKDQIPVPSNNSPAKIVFVRQKFTAFGGAELILDATMSAMVAKGIEVSLVGRSWNARQDIKFILCNPPRFPRIWREQRFANAACAIIGKLGTPIVQSHERIACCDIFCADEGVHAAYVEHRARGLGKLSAAMLRLHPYHRNMIANERRMFTSPRLRFVIVNSAMVAQEISSHYAVSKDRIFHLPLGFDLDRFNLRAKNLFRKSVRHELGVHSDRPVLLMVGSGYKRKGLDTAIRALAHANSDAELWVIGRDKNPNFYERLAARNSLGCRLRILGPVLDPLPYFGAADVLILPSIYDPFGAVVIEALACGLPVITSTSCGGREAASLLDGELVQDTYDVAGFTKAIDRGLEIAADPATAEKARLIAQNYSFDAMINRAFALYEKLQLARG